MNIVRKEFEFANPELFLCFYLRYENSISEKKIFCIVVAIERFAKVSPNVTVIAKA